MTIYNESYELFEFSEEESKSWRDLVIYGNLINFVIPPNGALEIEYEAWESATNITEYDFEEYGLGVVQSSNYTMNVSTQYTPRIIKCTKGVAKITINLIYVEVPVVETQKFRDCEVAVKHALHVGDHEVEQLFREIEAMKIIEYDRNVIAMLGWRMINDKPAIVFELAEEDLLHHVKMFKLLDGKEIPFKTIISILWQIAKGMEFIASKDIVHRDLATRNVLLTNDLQAKISDFGLAVINNSGMKEANLPKRLPIRWMSIEAIVEKLFSEKSDVWAFGVLMYEVFSIGQDPYAGIETGKLLRFLRSGERMSRPELATNEMYEMMCHCWEENVETRPKFEELVAKLHDVLEGESGYAKYYEELELLQEQEDSCPSNVNNFIEVLDEHI
uniref:Protein kinase domain-containing protein n=1 Tax=Acrobeloides nanus TaxID=290746 RepID=A0A914DX37_9BILA